MESKIINELKIFSNQFSELGEFREPNKVELDFYQRSNTTLTSAMYVPHDNQYQTVLKLITKKDIVVDMGAGDFRLPVMLAQKAKKVYAVELNPELVSKALNIIKYRLPSNLIIICTDWFNFPIPNEVTTIICLCNNPKIPEFWYKYKIILGTTAGISIINKQKRGES